VIKKTVPDKVFVLDTSALLALRGDEPGADRVQALLEQSKRKQCRVLASFMTRMELLYCVEREEGEESAIEALRLVDSFVMEWVSCESVILEKAAGIKSHGGLSVADAWIAATASIYGATLVHKDPEFSAITGVSQEFLSASG
jgi:predicted nucleic acid-binding protein